MKERTMNEAYDALAAGSIKDREVLMLGLCATAASAALAFAAAFASVAGLI